MPNNIVIVALEVPDDVSTDKDVRIALSISQHFGIAFVGVERWVYRASDWQNKPATHFEADPSGLCGRRLIKDPAK